MAVAVFAHVDLAKRALVVDDDGAIRLMLSRCLTRSRFDVHSAIDGAEALEKLAENRYDVVLLDLMMPRVAGEAVVRHLAETDPSTLRRVIVITASGADRQGPPTAAFLEKPFDLDQLMQHVSNCCEESRGNSLSS